MHYADPPIQKVAQQIMYPLSPPPRLLSFLWIFAKLTGGAQFRQIAVFATLSVLKFDKLKGSLTVYTKHMQLVQYMLSIVNI